MKFVLLSGGSGQRLWPLSNGSYSKQFLKVLGANSGNPVSMAQRVWSQMKMAGMREDAYILASRDQSEILVNQLNENLPMIYEPERRDTFPAVALAVSYLYSIEKYSEHETVVILPVDPYADDSFFQTIKTMEDVLIESGADLALIGAKPSTFSNKYGYIVFASEDKHILSKQSIPKEINYKRVKTFIEKPDANTAKKIYNDGAYWNCGVFAFRLSFLLKRLKELGLPTEYERLYANYGRLKKISFDYEIVEYTNEIVALPYEGMWKDLGTWGSLVEELDDNIIGIGKKCSQSDHTYIVNYLEIPVLVQGTNNVIVAAAPDGILVSDLRNTDTIKRCLEGMERRPMYEERRWGWYRVLEHNVLLDKEVLTKRIKIYAEKNISYQYHTLRSEVWTIICGEGEIALDGIIYSLRPGDVVRVPEGMHHGIKAIEDIELIEIQMGSCLTEEDIVRIYLDWTEVEANLTRKQGTRGLLMT